MPQVLLTESISAELGAQEPWPNDVRLYQPLEVEQILLPESSSCLATAAFLRMAHLPYITEECPNAEHMSPSGRVPFIKAGAFLVAELDHIISFVGHKGVSLTEGLDKAQKADMRAYMSLVTNVLGTAELYVSWQHADTYRLVTAPRYGSVYPWPLNALLTRQRRRTACNRLALLGWRGKTLDEVFEEVDNCCRALAQRLDTQPYFFGASPTELDAVVFGHLYTLLTTKLPDSRLASVVLSYLPLVRLCNNIDMEYFKGRGMVDDGHFRGERIYKGIGSRRSSRVEGASGRSSRAGDVGLKSGRTSRAEDESASAEAVAADVGNRTAEAGNGGGSNGDYDKLDDVSQMHT